MLFPRFSIRTALIITTGCALFCVMQSIALRGQTWAWGISIALFSLLLTAVVHAALFGLVWLVSLTDKDNTRPAREKKADVT